MINILLKLIVNVLLKRMVSIVNVLSAKAYC